MYTLSKHASMIRATPITPTGPTYKGRGEEGESDGQRRDVAMPWLGHSSRKDHLQTDMLMS